LKFQFTPNRCQNPGSALECPRLQRRPERFHRTRTGANHANSFCRPRYRHRRRFHHRWLQQIVDAQQFFVIKLRVAEFVGSAQLGGQPAAARARSGYASSSATAAARHDCDRHAAHDYVE
jgi:hypothetical protein